jgi:hypothetical protein
MRNFGNAKNIIDMIQLHLSIPTSAYDDDLYERRKSVLSNFTGEAYNVIYAKHIFSYNIVIYQANHQNF